MALIPCEECGREVSTRAQTCPHCGAPVAQPTNPVPTDQLRPSDVSSETEESERELYVQDALRITTKRFVVGDKTYAIRGVTSVEVKRLPDPPKKGVAKIGCGGCLTVFGFLALLGTAAADDKGPLVMVLGIGIVILIVGAHENLTTIAAPEFAISLRSSSGETQVYTSTDEAAIRVIAGYLTAAIAA